MIIMGDVRAEIALAMHILHERPHYERPPLQVFGKNYFDELSERIREIRARNKT